MTATSASPAEIRPISHPSTNNKVFSLVSPMLGRDARLVDIGAGEGYFSMMVGEDVARRFGVAPSTIVSACDVFPDLYRYQGVRCDQIHSDGRLPYADERFDIACSLEVVEHVEDQFLFAREIFRILRPGGTAILSTPNVLNINSRLRQLHSGFGVLFDPLLLSSTDPVHTSGHINPVSFYYLAYQLHRAGFSTIRVEYDRFKASANAMLVAAGIFVGAGNALFRRRLARKKPEVAMENGAILDAMSSRQMLTSRSIIVVASK